jgi:hypothetical protein
MSLILGAAIISGFSSLTAAENAVEFPGTVLAADAAAGKLTVKKQDGGTRFTFVVNDKTQFGPPWKSLQDVKKGDAVTVTYATSGSQYIAQKVTKGK